ncbi:MAG TPA: hypothetical protein VGJ57_06950 [Nitrospirales bacterium]
MSDGQTLASVKHWRVWSGIAVVFVCGLLVGNIATTAYDNYKQQQKWEQGLAGLKQRARNHLTRELGLSVEQQLAIEPILSHAETELLQLRMAQQPHVEETVTRTTTALKAKLSPAQQTKLDELYHRLQQRWDSDRRYVSGLPHTQE